MPTSKTEGTGFAEKVLEIVGLYVRETDPTQTGVPVLTGLVTGFTPGLAGKFMEAGIYSHGCVLTKTDGATGFNANFENVGTIASPSWKVWSAV